MEVRFNRVVSTCDAIAKHSFADLSLSQILPMLDEETGVEPRILSASIADPYLLLIRDDSSAFIAHMDSNNELEELERGDKLTSTKWLTGCLYTDKSSIFAKSQPRSETKSGENVVMFLLSAAGALHVGFSLINAALESYLTHSP